MKKILLMLLASICILIGCSDTDKTIVIDDNVLMQEIKNSNKIKKEEINIPLEEGYIFEPGFFYKDKIYGVLKKQDSEKGEFYNVYYSDSEGLVKVKKIKDMEEYSNMSYKSRIVIGWGGKNDDNYYMVDNATGDKMLLPRIQITEKEQIRNSAPLKDDSGNVNVEFLINNSNDGIMTSGGYDIVDGNENFGYDVVTKGSWKDTNNDGRYYDKIDYDAYENVQSVMVLFDLENKKTITYGGDLSAADFPIISSIIYSEKNNKFYAIAGELQNEIYEINISNDTYSISLFYKLDLQDRITRIWNSKIVENSIFLETYVPSEVDEGGSFTLEDVEKILLSLDNKEIATFEKDNEDIKYNSIKLNSIQYLIISRCDIKAMKSKIYLGRVKYNKVEYIYEFENGVSNVIMDDEGKTMINYYISKSGPKYELYTLDVD